MKLSPYKDILQSRHIDKPHCCRRNWPGSQLRHSYRLCRLGTRKSRIYTGRTCLLQTRQNTRTLLYPRRIFLPEIPSCCNHKPAKTQERARWLCSSVAHCEAYFLINKSLGFEDLLGQLNWTTTYLTAAQLIVAPGVGRTGLAPGSHSVGWTLTLPRDAVTHLPRQRTHWTFCTKEQQT